MKIIDLHNHTNFSYDGISGINVLVENAIKNNVDVLGITDHEFSISERIDEYIKAERYFATEREKIIDRQRKIIDAPFKDEIIDQIKCEVLKRYEGITSKELEHFSTNVYIYAILFAHNVDKLKVGAILNNLNCLYVEKWQEDGIVKDNVINEVTPRKVTIGNDFSIVFLFTFNIPSRNIKMYRIDNNKIFVFME